MLCKKLQFIKKSLRISYERFKSIENYELDFSIGGFPQGQNRVFWDGTFLNIYKPGNVEPIDTYIIDDILWKNFWTIMDEINVWKWEKEYH